MSYTVRQDDVSGTEDWIQYMKIYYNRKHTSIMYLTERTLYALLESWQAGTLLLILILATLTTTLVNL